MRLFRRETVRSRSLVIEALESRYALDSGIAALPANYFAAALIDDIYEENDTLATAANLGTLTGTRTISNLVMADASDFFKFTMTATGTSASKIVLNFTNSQGDLDIVLLNSAGRQLKISQGVANSETISLSGLAAGTYTIRVYGYRGVQNPSYNLAFTTPGTTTTPPSTIDLVGAAFDAPNSSTWGSSVSITASVKNNGNSAAGSFREQWYLSRDTTYSTDDVVLNLSTGLNYSTISGLAAGATTALNATLVLPSALPSGWTGTSFYLVMRTDSAGSVAETNENNNGGQAGAGLDFEAITITTVTTPPTTPTTPFPNVAYFGGTREWNLNAINAPESWAQGYRGQGVIVAVIDTGVDWDHTDLASQIWVNPGEIAGNGLDDDQNGYVDDVRGWDFISNDNNPDDGDGHGTHVAGTVAAANNGVGATGVAPNATIMPVRVLGNDGSGSSNGVANGIRYAAANGADIINLSLGGSLSSAIQSAIQYAQQRNVLVVVAAGNESAAVPSYPARHSATLTNTISVGAYSSSYALASFSNDVGTSGAVQVDAPGVSIYNTYLGGTYSTLSGTSMATPHVAGLAALALSANANLTASQLRTLIVDGTTQAVSGSDSQGGVNAAVTVALAAALRSSSSLGTAVNTNLANSSTTGSTGINVRYWTYGSSELLAEETAEYRTPSPTTAIDRHAFFAALSERGNSSASITTLTRSSASITTLSSITRSNPRQTEASLSTSNGLGERVVSNAEIEADSALDSSETAMLELLFGEEAADWRA